MATDEALEAAGVPPQHFLLPPIEQHQRLVTHGQLLGEVHRVPQHHGAGRLDSRPAVQRRAACSRLGCGCGFGSGDAAIADGTRRGTRPAA